MIARTLSLRVVMRTGERDIFEALRFFTCEPDIPDFSATDHFFRIDPVRSWLTIREDGAASVELLDARAAVHHIHTRLMALSLGARPRAATLHAACLRRRGRRILLVGREQAGKTTLALRLALAGYELEGDEHVFLEPDGVVARPRACRVKESSIDLLPEIGDAIATSPSYVDDHGRITFNVDPRVAGSPWRLERGPADRVIILSPNHGGFSRIRPLPPIALAERMMMELGTREQGGGAAVAAVAALTRTCVGFDLSLGDHAGAVRCIDRVLD